MLAPTSAILTSLAATIPASRIAPTWAFWIVALPLIAMGLMGLCAVLNIKSKLPAWLTVLSLGASFGLTFALFSRHFMGADASPLLLHGFEWMSFTAGEGHRFTADFALYIDPLACLWMLFITGLATLIALYASEYMSHDLGPGYCRFFAAFNLFVFSMLCLVMADNLVLLFLGWEGVGLCSYLLIGYFYKKPEAVAAAKKAFIMNRIGDLGLLMAIFGIYLTFGTVEYAKLFPMIQSGIDASGNAIGFSWIVKVIPLLLTAGAFGKSAQLFLYVWLPDAMEGPTPVSALIHAATMVTAGVFLVARMYPLFLADPAKIALSVVAWSGALTAIWAATIAMATYDIKRIMGYSTVSQLGFMFAGLGLLTTGGAVFHVFTHAFFKATLFLCCGAVMHGFAGQLDLRKLSGISKLPGWKITTVAMLIGAANLAGVPFTAGFFSKDMILAQAFATPDGAGIVGPRVVGWILLLTAGLTAYYTFRVFFRVFVGPVAFEAGEEAHGHEGDHAHDKHDQGHGQGQGHGHGHNHGHAPAHTSFHPHAPGPAINIVMALCAALSIAAAFTYRSHTNFSLANPLPTVQIVETEASHSAPHAHGATAAHAPEGNAAQSHGWVAGMVDASSAALASPHGGTLFSRDPHQLMYYVSGAIGLFGIATAWFLHLLGRTTSKRAPADDLMDSVPGLESLHAWANGKWFVDEFYHTLIVRPLHTLAHVFHLFDAYVIDGIVNLIGAIPGWLGRIIRPTQSGELHGYALGMAGGLAVLLVIVIALMT